MSMVSQCYLSRPAQREALLLNILINTHGQDGSISFIEAWQKAKTLFHIEDFESSFWTNEGGPFWVMIVFSPINDKDFDDSKSSMWKSV